MVVNANSTQDISTESLSHTLVIVQNATFRNKDIISQNPMQLKNGTVDTTKNQVLKINK